MQARFLSMRVLCALSAAVAVVSNVQAQSFTEGWEPGPLTPGVAAVPANWTSVNNSTGGPGTNPNWQVRNDGAVFAAFAGTTYAFANYNSSTNANDISNYLMSPLLTFNNGDTISFYTRTVSAPAFPDRMELVYNTTGSTNPADFTNVLLTVNPGLTLAGYPTTWTQFTATITGLSGATGGRFAFHYNPTNGGPLGNNSDYIGVDEVVFTGTGGGTPATNTNLGAGCGAAFNSAYQFFADSTASSAALTGNALALTPTANGYVTTWLPGTAAALYVAPGGGATTLGTGDDGDVVVTPSMALQTPYGAQASLRVSGNGIVAFGANAIDFPGTLSYVPTAGGFLNSLQGGVYAWHDYNAAEAGSGPVQSEQVGGTLYITYNGVENYANPELLNPSTLQFQLDLASGDIRIVFVSIDSNATSAFGSAMLVGVTAPGNSLDSGSVNLAVGNFITTSPEHGALALVANSRPVTGTNWNLQVNNGALLDLIILGVTDPNIPDLFFLGLPGCGLRASLDLITIGSTVSVAIPANPTLVGQILYANGASLAPGVNAFGAITSNGIAGTIGDV